MFTYKVDDDITLKLKDYQNCQEVFELIDASREHLKQWMTWVDQVHSEEDVDRVTRRQLLEFVKKTGMHLLIVYKGEVAGSVSLKDIDWTIRSAEIGYWLGTSYIGKGIMVRAVKSLLAYAFEELGLHKVEIWAAEKNTSSRKIPEKLGFVTEGMRRDDELINDTYVTMIIYGILKEEWEQANT